MKTRLLKTVALLAFTAWTTLALADDPPSRVGRIALTEGLVSVSGPAGESASGALANWPVSARDRVTTSRGARTELQIGSTLVRIDGDTSLEVTELDDANLRLRLNYGSASINITNPEVLGGFELATPEGRMRMQEPGRVRVDAERVRDTTSVTVFDGVAQADAGGSSLTVRAGKRADLSEDDVRTTQAVPDAFDQWAQARDNSLAATVTSRYVATEMTGYRDLDRYGSWRVDAEYGPLWIPSVAPGWVPYSDGRWAWIEPWGWTWVDNAPWGYAPFHYGRWVFAGNRWSWAPGWRDVRPAWAPALVGWVGGGGVSIYAGRREHVPAQAWFPLSPRDRFVPGYIASDDYLRRMNRYARPFDRRDWERHRQGLTAVPHDRFGRRGEVVVPKEPRVAMPGPVLQTAPGAAPPPPPGVRQRDGRHEERGDDRRWTERGAEFRRGQGSVPQTIQPLSPVTVLTAPSVVPAQFAQPRQPVLPYVPPPRPPVTVLTPTPQISGQPAHPQPLLPNVPEPRQPVTVLTPPIVLPGQQQVQPQPDFRGARRQHFDEGGHGERPGRWIGSPGPRQDPRGAPVGVAPPNPIASPLPAPVPMPAPRAAPAPTQGVAGAAPRGAGRDGSRHGDGNARMQQR